MGIVIHVGNTGSGKTATAVWEMYNDPRKLTTYSNIITRGIDNNKVITPDMICKKDVKEVKKKRDGSENVVYDWKLNLDFWKGLPKPLNVVIDEAHNIINARKSMSKANVLITDWLAMLRRVIGSADSGTGDLVFITQLINRVDVIAREMSTKIKFFRCHYVKTCQKCGFAWRETNDNPEPANICYRCGEWDLRKHSHRIEVYHFMNMNAYQGFDMFGMKTYHRHYFINQIEDIFPMYDTLQWDNLFESIY